MVAGSPNVLRDLLEPALASSGLELWDVEVTHDSVRVLVDRPGGIDLDALSGVASEVVSPLLDDHPELTPPDRFQLEVSSPGVERTLRRVEQFRRYVGSELSVKTTVVVAGARRHHGVLLAVDDGGIRLAPRDTPAGTEVAIGHDQIDRARTVASWGPKPAPSPSRGRPSPKPVPAANHSKDTAS